MTIDQSLKRDLVRQHQPKKQQKGVGEEKSKSDLDQQIISSSKQVLLHKIDFKPAEKSFSFKLENLRTKYVPLNPVGKGHDVLKQTKTGDRQYQDTMMSQHPSGDITTGHNDGIPMPKVVLFPLEKLRLDWHKVTRIGSGLMNLGNTCFLNSALQCLTYTPPLTNYLMSQQHTQSCREPGFCMICELQRHAIRTFNQSGSVIRPMVIIQKIKNIGKQFRYGHQEDAHEFLRGVTEAMQKSALSGYDKLDRYSKETTLVHQIFGGYYRSRVQCLKCQEKSDTHDPFLDISLDIKHVSSVVRALERMIKPETLENDNMYLCKRCKVKVPALKRFTVHRPPNILTLSLKRFDFNRYIGSKITKDVRYPEFLDLRPYMSQKSGPAIMYRLYAVLVHHGYSCNSGHYYCYVRAPNDSWYCMNDSNVSQSSLKTILDQEAYILFYIRKPSTKSQQSYEKTSMTNNSTFSPSLTFTNRVSSSSTITSGHVSNPVNGPIGKPIVRPIPKMSTPTQPKSSKLGISTSSQYKVTNKPTTIPEPSKREKVHFNIGIKPKTTQQQHEPQGAAGNSADSKHTVKTEVATPAVTAKMSEEGRKKNDKDAALVPYAGDSDDSCEDYDETVARLCAIPLQDDKNTSSNKIIAATSSSLSSDVKKKESIVSDNGRDKVKRESKEHQNQKPELSLIVKETQKSSQDSDVVKQKDAVEVSLREQEGKEDKEKDKVKDKEKDKDKNKEKSKEEYMKPPEQPTPVKIPPSMISPNLNRTPSGASQNSPLKLTLSKVNTFKVNATSTSWKVNDSESQISPSLASDSSNHSVTSTGGEWTVVDKKDALSTPKIREFSHPGWVVRTPEEFAEYTKQKEEEKAKLVKDKEHNQDGSEDVEKNKMQGIARLQSSPPSIRKFDRQHSYPQSAKHTPRHLFSNGNIDRKRRNSLSDTSNLDSDERTKLPWQHDNLQAEKRKFKEEDVDETLKKQKLESNEEEFQTESDKVPLLNGDDDSPHKKHKKHKKHKHKKKKKKRSKDRHKDEDRDDKHTDDSEDESHREERKRKKKHKHKEDKVEEDRKSLLGQEHQHGDDTNGKVNGNHSLSKKTKVPSQQWDHHIKDGYKRSHDRETSTRKSWDGSRSSNVVDELLSRSSSKGYGAHVESWDGGKCVIDEDTERDREDRKRLIDDYDVDYDRGKERKVKRYRSEDFRYKSNPFQHVQNRRNSGYSDKGFRYHKMPSRSQSWNSNYKHSYTKY